MRSLISPWTALNGPCVCVSRKAICCLCPPGSCCSRAPDMAAQWILLNHKSNIQKTRQQASCLSSTSHVAALIHNILCYLRKDREINRYLFTSVRLCLYFILYARSLRMNEELLPCVKGESVGAGDDFSHWWRSQCDAISLPLSTFKGKTKCAPPDVRTQLGFWLG